MSEHTITFSTTPSFENSSRHTTTDGDKTPSEQHRFRRLEHRELQRYPLLGSFGAHERLMRTGMIDIQRIVKLTPHFLDSAINRLRVRLPRVREHW